MSLPHLDSFEEVLNSLRSNLPEKREFEIYVAAPEEIVSIDGKKESYPPIPFWYKPRPDLTIQGLLRKVSEELLKAGYEANTSIAAIVLAIFSHRKRKGSSAMNQFNILFSEITSADLNQYLFFRGVAPQHFGVEVGP